MAANSSLNLTSLDPDVLKSNFITFLQSQTAFKDYNFTGPNISVLLDILSYNSFLNAFYLNMIGSEMFLDSAQKFDSVVSHAKELNYLPRSPRSAVANISFTLDTIGIPNPLSVPKGFIVSGANANGNFTFVTNQSYSFLSANSYTDLSNNYHLVYDVKNISIYEGTYVQDTFVVDYTQENQKFVISNPGVDTNNIEVNVIEDDAVNVFTRANTLYELNSNSKIFFIQATFDHKYEIVFGDGIFGRYPINNSIIIIKYIKCNGSDGSGIMQFSIDQDLGTLNNGIGRIIGSVAVNSPSTGGANQESIESIRYNAPRHYETQENCITLRDYENVILNNFPEVQYVHAFNGGITKDSVNFGTVFISPSTYSGTSLTTSRKNEITSFVSKRNTTGISPVVIDPDYMFVKIDCILHIDLNQTTSSLSTIKSLIFSNVNLFNKTNLQNFNTALRISRLESKINDSDTGILSNEIVATIFKIFQPPLGFSAYSINCELENAIIPGSVTSSQFVFSDSNYVFTDKIPSIGDNGNGIIYILEQNASLTQPNFKRIGIVDYTTGKIDINPLNYISIGGGISIKAQTQSQDIYCKNNTILEIDTTNNFTIFALIN